MISKLIGKVKRSSVVKRYFEPIVVNALEGGADFNGKVIGNFRDSFDNNYDLIAGLRSKIKPGWQSILNPANNNKIPTKAELKTNIIEAKRHIKNLKGTLNSFDINLKDKSVLEVGCYNGIKTYLMALEDCKSITGSDVSFYYENQTSNVKEPEVNSYLARLRRDVFNLFSENERSIINQTMKFVEDDISKSSLPDNSFDIITSWETLEHIIDIDSAFANIKRILKPNGIAVHQYNPFFSLNGGHSLCTLDFLWGHCRLSEKDVLRYFRELRPAEYQLASSFYLDSLNRLTLNGLKAASAKAGLEILALIPFVKKAHLSVYKDNFYKETKRNYPTVEPTDLFSPVVWVVHRKK
jgi:2-polyprenyl-3-methyl-5-hydroxy-6-metoxy-1,4-benzoquinol methylase